MTKNKTFNTYFYSIQAMYDFLFRDSAVQVDEMSTLSAALSKEQRRRFYHKSDCVIWVQSARIKL